MLEKNNIPRHVAIIMDGNGRWAKEKSLPRTAGHREGAKRVEEIVKAAAELGVKAVTFFAFSTENWSRPKKEIAALMRYLNDFLSRQIEELDKNNIRFRAIGLGAPLTQALLKKISDAEEKTGDNTGLIVVLALNYGSRQEIVEAARNFAEDALRGKKRIEDLDAGLFAQYLCTAGMPDPDLLIRTSGEMRISNFLLWQLSYAELYFTQKYWPDFRRADFEEALSEYQRRERRFGAV
ncbi:MAG: di-trans,poly-cis-decaprenylcistransferase [Omnitrophica WOR_2 bacterium RIFCSPLOWO2_12_FULL_51_8]|nr:MAG: di-trans,poly-cis-decaprenylcistransferase [Omnitrophica WOR_2 bacterium RIFCSPLOWO2_12_FULL_51_8]